ncbi:MAG: FecR domain-containing protein [Ginsengibacter sp.]
MQVNYERSEDFISDESFVSWFHKNDENSVQKWDLWLQSNPGKEGIVEDAVQFLRILQTTENGVSPEKLNAAEQELRSGMQAGSKVISIRRNRFWYAAAAVVIFALLVTIGLTYFLSPSKQTQLATQYGQIKHERLPDGTEVVLNANSRITYGKWQKGALREVWVNGEALFHVQKTPEHSKFIVHTNAFDIEVTGTTFNVINTPGKSNVVLQEGTVRIHRSGVDEIVMKPGDFVEFSNQQIQKKTVTKRDYLAWTESKLVFDNTTLKEIATIIKDHYGVDVQFADKSVADKTITGIMPNDNLDVLLKALEATLDCNIQHANNKIVINSK